MWVPLAACFGSWHRHDNIKGKTCWINGRYSISKNSTPKMIWFGGTSCVMISLTYYELTLMLLILVHVVCCLSPVKFHSWVHTIILCILVIIFDWPVILTQYMLPRTEPYLFSSLFSFYEMQRVYLWLLISLSSSQPPAYQVPGWAIHSSSCWILSVVTWCPILSDTYHFILLFWCIWYY